MTELRHVKPAGTAIFKDRYTTKVKELLTPWEDGKTAAFAIAGAPFSKSSISHSGASFAPSAIRSALQSYTTFSGGTGIDFGDTIIDFGDVNMDPTDVIGNQQRLYEGLSDIYATEAAPFWMVLGGDHAISHSSIKAFSEKNPSVGVIQFDAHHDLRNVEDGGPTNGTPFRRLIEDGILDGENLIQLGIRDFTNAAAYADYAKEKGVVVYTMQDLARELIEKVLERELAKLSDRVDVIYLSVDMDVLDQAFAPGCPAIGPGGMDSNTLLTAVHYAAQHEKVKAMDIVEIDPTIDIRNMTSRVAANVMLQFMLGKRI
ncbi:formimidoylglutamase [Virgibacillus phasianinus]|uniref:Formimidoylglutamase n=1 Tax=Virgibacillus phasianinus TaxID=2017483 RepID=A0A220U1I7_9BACI|nr:formimidoylglutamase [Virgibacillus phasianinus]ASK62008.1 formimidoylglutamase [Virgibacillus phasianinus]